MEWSTTSMMNTTSSGGGGAVVVDRKRPPADELLEEQPLFKKLEYLSLNQHPFTKRTKRKSKKPSHPHPHPHPHPPAQLKPTPPSQQQQQQQQEQQQQQQQQPLQNERMEVDNVIYIDSLTSSSSSSEDEEDGKLVFLPDIEKELKRIPYSVLKAGPGDGNISSGVGGGGSGGGGEGGMSTDLVLYSVPASLGVSEEEGDSVRRAILESRERIRMRQQQQGEEEARARGMAGGFGAVGESGVMGMGVGMEIMQNVDDDMSIDDDPDAMEIE